MRTPRRDTQSNRRKQRTPYRRVPVITSRQLYIDPMEQEYEDIECSIEQKVNVGNFDEKPNQSTS